MTLNPDVDLDLNLVTGESGPCPEPERAAHARRDQAAPLADAPPGTRSMAPNLQLTYLDRVLMEIIETERMYVRDLRMIVEVSDASVT